MLIYDRTQEDVDRAREYAEIGYKNLSPSQRDEWDNGLKGCYTIFDLNRVALEMERISRIFNDAGYENVIDVRSDWVFDDILTKSDIDDYLDNVEILRRAFFVLLTTPETPINIKPYTYANDIEKILFDIISLYQNNLNEKLFLGEKSAGERIGIA